LTGDERVILTREYTGSTWIFQPLSICTCFTDGKTFFLLVLCFISFNLFNLARTFETAILLLNTVSDDVVDDESASKIDHSNLFSMTEMQQINPNYQIVLNICFITLPGTCTLQKIFEGNKMEHPISAFDVG
jgi:hypothetical protein